VEEKVLGAGSTVIDVINLALVAVQITLGAGLAGFDPSISAFLVAGVILEEKFVDALGAFVSFSALFAAVGASMAVSVFAEVSFRAGLEAVSLEEEHIGSTS
jgi:hypothetical protein